MQHTDRRWWVLGLLGLAFLMTTLDGTIMLAALPRVAEDLDLGPEALQWTVTAYAVTFSGLLLLCGRVADHAGRRRVFLIGVALRIGAALACALAWNGGVLIAGRALQGLSAAVIAPAVLSMVTTTFEEGPERNRALGIWAGLGGVGATAGLLLGGLITVRFGWQGIFYLNVPVCLAVLAAGPVVLRRSETRRAEGFDIAGAAAITAVLALVILGVVGVATTGWLSVRTLGPLVLAGGVAALFVLIESRAAAPLVPFRVLRSADLVGGNLLMLTAGMAVDGMLVTLTGFLQRALGWSATQFGLTAAAMTVTSVVGVMTSQQLVTRIGIRAVAVTGSLVLGAGCLLLSRVSADGGSPVLFAGLVVFGAGMGGAFVGAQISAFTGVRDEDSGLAAGFIDTSFAMGTALGVAVCSSVAVSLTGGDGAGALTAGYRGGFAAAAAFCLAGALVALMLVRPSVRAPERARQAG